jgi:hypothetical protein
VKDFAVTSGGERIANPRHLERKAAGSPATSAGWPAASAARRTGPRRRPGSPAPTARYVTPAGTSCTAPAPAWSARRTRSWSRT